jgi:hypothetical protein
MPIRRFVNDDIPQVAALHDKIFGHQGKCPARALPPQLRQELHRYLERVFLDNPWYDEALPSLVATGPHGRISGFLGVVPRRMSLNGRPVRVAVSTQFIVDPDSRGHGAALLFKFFSGPQDLALADDANADGRRAWEAAGGATALPYSLRWTRLLSPARYLASELLERARLRRLEVLARPFCHAADSLARRRLPHWFGSRAPAWRESELTVGTLVEYISLLAGDTSLRPDYEEPSLHWALESAAQKTQFGPLRKRLVRDENGEVRGWYIYHAKPAGTSTVLQLAGRDGSIGAILDHLFFDARQQHSLAVSGILLPQWAPVFSEKKCFLNYGRPWTLVHSRRSEIMAAFQRGNVFLSRLDGEWPMRFA